MGSEVPDQDQPAEGKSRTDYAELMRGSRKVGETREDNVHLAESLAYRADQKRDAILDGSESNPGNQGESLQGQVDEKIGQDQAEVTEKVAAVDRARNYVKHLETVQERRPHNLMEDLSRLSPLDTRVIARDTEITAHEAVQKFDESAQEIADNKNKPPSRMSRLRRALRL